MFTRRFAPRAASTALPPPATHQEEQIFVVLPFRREQGNRNHVGCIALTSMNELTSTYYLIIVVQEEQWTTVNTRYK